MIVHIVFSKVSLGEGDENGSTTIFCLTLKVNKFVRTQYSLEIRRLRADLMLCFKMLKEFVDVDASELFERVAPDSMTRGHRYKLVHPSVNVRQHFFAVRIIPVWNSLSSNVVEVESISCFKARLSREGLRRLSREGLRRLSREGLTKFVNI